MEIRSGLVSAGGAVHTDAPTWESEHLWPSVPVWLLVFLVAVHETEAVLEFTEAQAKLFGAYHHLAEEVENKAVAPPFKASLGNVLG